MKNFNNFIEKANKNVSFITNITISVAITLTAAVLIKQCLKDLLPKRRKKMIIHVVHDNSKEETASNDEKDLPELIK